MEIKKLRKIISNPWFITLVGGIIVGALLRIIFKIKVAILFGYIKNALAFKINMPLWSLFLLAIPAVLLIVSFLKNLIEIKDQPPIFVKYTADTFDGIAYRWEWRKTYEGKYQVTNLTPYCPVDKCRLLSRPITSFIGDVNNRIGYYCPSCNKEYDSKHGESALEALIHKNIEDMAKSGFEKIKEEL